MPAFAGNCDDESKGKYEQQQQQNEREKENSIKVKRLRRAIAGAQLKLNRELLEPEKHHIITIIYPVETFIQSIRHVTRLINNSPAKKKTPKIIRFGREKKLSA